MENTTKCPQCLMPVNKDDEKCPSCGSPLKGKKCPDCATFVAEGTDVCPMCGHQFNDESASLPVPPEELDGIIQKWKSQKKLAAFFSMNKLFKLFMVIGLLPFMATFFIALTYYSGSLPFSETIKTYKDTISLCRTLLIVSFIFLIIWSVIDYAKKHYLYSSLGVFAKENGIDLKSVIDGTLQVKLDSLTSKQKKSFSTNIRLLISAADYIDNAEQTSKNRTSVIVLVISTIVSCIMFWCFLNGNLEDFFVFSVIVKPILPNASLMDVLENWWVLIAAFAIAIISAIAFKPKYPIEAEWVKKNLPNKVQAFANLPIIKKK